MTATCIHCESLCRRTDGREIYPHLPHLYDKIIFVCDHCDARVGCHPGTDRPLGFAGNEATRVARKKLHNLMLDPLWKRFPTKPERDRARSRTYKFLAKALGIEPRECHTGMFTVERCRDAWKALRGQTPETIRQWSDARRVSAQEAHSDRQRKKHGRRRPAAEPRQHSQHSWTAVLPETSRSQ